MHASHRDSRFNNPRPIRTSLMEIVQALASQTSDDSLVLAAIKDIFRSNQVRLANTLAPLRLVEAVAPVRVGRRCRRRGH